MTKPSDRPDLQPVRTSAIPEDAAVLVLEDNVANFVRMARMLGFLGIHCEWKTSGYEVLEYADTLPRLDLILVDIGLPYEDGYSAQHKLRQSRRFRSVPIVAVAVEASPEQMNGARAAGFDGFIGEPFNPNRFPEQIRRIFDGEEIWEVA
jgi:two-component system cell cycle response regulator DivK